MDLSVSCKQKQRKRKTNSRVDGRMRGERDTVKGEALSERHGLEINVMSQFCMESLLWDAWCLSREEELCRAGRSSQGTWNHLWGVAPSLVLQNLQDVPSSTSIIIVLLFAWLEASFGYFPLECFFNDIRNQVPGYHCISQNTSSVARKDKTKISKREWHLTLEPFFFLQSIFCSRSSHENDDPQNHY